MIRKPKGSFIDLKLNRDSFHVDRRRILDAMRDFDLRYRQKESAAGTKFVVMNGERLYPPKRILGLAIGRPTSVFGGGRFTNSAFRRLGFKIGSALRRPARSWKDVAGPTPTVSEVLSRLFSQKWTKLDLEKLGNAYFKDSEFPGVYLIAYTGENIEGMRVDEKTVSYVGMSNHAGLKRRLTQFMQGLEDGAHHSATQEILQQACPRYFV